MSESRSYDDGSRLDVDMDVVAQWRGDFDRIDSERHLRIAPKPLEVRAEAWRTVQFIEGGARP